jgi:hypothetical protein
VVFGLLCANAHDKLEGIKIFYRRTYGEVWARWLALRGYILICINVTPQRFLKVAISGLD